jgi:apolipoprotein N-acyltransferase
MFYKTLENYLNNKYYLNKLSIGLLSISFPIIISLFIYQKEEKQDKYLDVTIIQPNIDPYNKKYGRTNFEILQEFKETTKSTKYNNQLIITPETYFSESPGYSLNDFFNTSFYKNLDNYLIDKNSEILSGIQFYKIYNSSKTKTKSSNYIKDSIWIDIYNSSFLNSNKNQIYHKSKLVVGVENLPYKTILEPLLGNLLLDFGGTVMTRATQPNRSVIRTKSNTIVAPVICYESMYGEYMTEYIRNGAQIIAIMTNDGWWGDSPGHKQLLSYSRLRSIESRRSIVRSANTGISAIINKKGDIIDSIDYEKNGIISGQIELSDYITFYVKYGDYIFRISLFFFIIIFLFYFAKKK